jgi:hypothetical protein
MKNVTNDKMFENINLSTRILTAPWKIGETILYRKGNKKERKPKKILAIQYTTKWYWTWSLTIEDRKTPRSYGWWFENEFYKGNTPQEIEATETIYTTWCVDEFWKDVFVRWFMIDWILYNKVFFTLTTLTDRPWLHERTKHWYKCIIK